MTGKTKSADNKGNSTKGMRNGDKKGDKKEEKGGKVKGCQQINVRHILHSKKEEALKRLNGGAKFDEVAGEMSEDKARQGGSLGWKTRGDLDPEFENVAFELEASTTANPKFAEVKSGFGYHILMVEGRK